MYRKILTLQLQNIKRDTVQDNERGRTYTLLDWLNQDVSKASWVDIVTALVKIKMGGLAQRLSDKYGEWMGMYIVSLLSFCDSFFLYITGVPMSPADEMAQAAQQGSESNHREVHVHC